MTRFSRASTRILFIAVSLSAAVPVRAGAPGSVPGAGPRMEEPLPASLDALFPPSSPAPVFLIAKHEMAGAMSGIMVDLMEQDLANVPGDFEAFKAGYLRVREMVPEWKDRFPLEPIEKLGTALGGGDPDGIQAAFREAGGVCAGCHATAMSRVQAKYHWPRFDAISSEDPLSGRTVGFGELMHLLDAGLAGVSLNLRQGQIDNARKSYKAFASRFDALAESCSGCHDSERHYFVDAGVRTMVAQLGQALDGPAPDPKVLASLGEGIGRESCHKCHLVHVPAAMEQARALHASDGPR